MKEAEKMKLAKGKIYTISLEEAASHPLLLAVNVSLGNVHQIKFDEDRSVYVISEEQYNLLCKEYLEL